MSALRSLSLDHDLILALGKQIQSNLCEFGASLVFISSFRTARDTARLCLKKPNKQLLKELGVYSQTLGTLMQAEGRVPLYLSGSSTQKSGQEKQDSKLLQQCCLAKRPATAAPSLTFFLKLWYNTCNIWAGRQLNG